MKTTFNAHIDDERVQIDGSLICDHEIARCATIKISADRSHDLRIFGDADRFELLGRKCLEIADELREAEIAQKNEQIARWKESVLTEGEAVA